MSVLTKITHQLARRLCDDRRYVTRAPAQADATGPAVYLTFDDGPHPDRTNRILDQFAESDSKATFFVIGRRARRHPQTVRRILADGHSVGCHTWRHWSARQLSSQAYVDDVRRSRTEIEQITGRKIDLFRPPYGELTPVSLWKLLADGFRIIHWTRDTRDFQLPAIPVLQQRFAELPMIDGDIILMHDDASVTSYALHSCLQSWEPRLQFLALPMATPGSHRRPLTPRSTDQPLARMERVPAGSAAE